MRLPTTHSTRKPSDRTHDSWYDSALWRRTRLYVLRRDCHTCAGCGQAASHVDHIRPRGECADEYDPANLQSLCAHCHTRKTNAAKRGDQLFQTRPSEDPPRAR